MLYRLYVRTTDSFKFECKLHSTMNLKTKTESIIAALPSSNMRLSAHPQFAPTWTAKRITKKVMDRKPIVWSLGVPGSTPNMQIQGNKSHGLREGDHPLYKFSTIPNSLGKPGGFMWFLDWKFKFRRENRKINPERTLWKAWQAPYATPAKAWQSGTGTAHFKDDFRAVSRTGGLLL